MAERRMVDDQRGGRDVEGEGMRIGDDNTQVNFSEGSQSAASGRDVYVAGRDIVSTVHQPEARGCGRKIPRRRRLAVSRWGGCAMP